MEREESTEGVEVKTIKMTKEQYLEKHKELVTLLGMDMIEKRIQSEQDGLTVYQYGYIFALEKRITELEYQLGNYKAAADGTTHWCAECKMRDDKIKELGKRIKNAIDDINATDYCVLRTSRPIELRKVLERIKFILTEAPKGEK